MTREQTEKAILWFTAGLFFIALVELAVTIMNNAAQIAQVIANATRLEKSILGLTAGIFLISSVELVVETVARMRRRLRDHAPQGGTRKRKVVLSLSVVVVALLLGLYVLFRGIGSKYSIAITSPPVFPPGPQSELTTSIGGKASVRGGGGKPLYVVVYAHSGYLWWVQPFEDSDPKISLHMSGSWLPQTVLWSTYTHKGVRYAALLVTKDFKPATRPDQLPDGDDVLAFDIR
ncbi:MAG: hypothetical protein ABR964_10485 [Tepidisphaeraceae bacterium]